MEGDSRSQQPDSPAPGVAVASGRRRSRRSMGAGGATVSEDATESVAVAESLALALSSSVDRLTASQARLGWMFPPQMFAYKRRGSESSMKRKVKKFYDRQDELVGAYERIYTDIVQTDEKEFEFSSMESTTCSIRLAQLSFFANLALTAIKTIAIALSGSLSVVSSLIDSVIDLVSGVVVWVANRQVKSSNRYHYPQGKSRLEPVAIVILAVIMATSTVQIVIAAVQSIIAMVTAPGPMGSNGTVCPCPDGQNGTIDVIVPSALTQSTKTDWFYVFGLVGSVIVIKFILFILCYKFGNTPSTDALSLDHRNDCVSNSTVLVMTILSAYIWPYFDAIGALIISCYIIYTWVETLRQQIRLLTGYTADPEFLKQIIFICINHHPLIRHIETVRAFHIGNNHLVEVDIVIPGDLNLSQAHDIGESLQKKIERLDWVERAFVHVDYEFDHHPTTEHKQI